MIHSLGVSPSTCRHALHLLLGAELPDIPRDLMDHAAYIPSAVGTSSIISGKLGIRCTVFPVNFRCNTVWRSPHAETRCGERTFQAILPIWGRNVHITGGKILQHARLADDEEKNLKSSPSASFPSRCPPGGFITDWQHSSHHQQRQQSAQHRECWLIVIGIAIVASSQSSQNRKR